MRANHRNMCSSIFFAFSDFLSWLLPCWISIIYISPVQCYTQEIWKDHQTRVSYVAYVQTIHCTKSKESFWKIKFGHFKFWFWPKFHFWPQKFGKNSNFHSLKLDKIKIFCSSHLDIICFLAVLKGVFRFKALYVFWICL